MSRDRVGLHLGHFKITISTSSRELSQFEDKLQTPVCVCVREKNQASGPAHVFILLSQVTKGEPTVPALIFVCLSVDSKDAQLSLCKR